MPDYRPTITRVEVEGRTLKLTSLDKLLYPATETTKGEVLNYYATVAPILLEHMAARPVTRVRWPHGVIGDSFFDTFTNRLLQIQTRFLGKIPDFDTFRRPDRAHEVLIFSGHDLQQRALAGTIAAQHANFGTRIKCQPNVRKHFLLIIQTSHVLNGHYVLLGHRRNSFRILKMSLVPRLQPRNTLPWRLLPPLPTLEA